MGAVHRRQPQAINPPSCALLAPTKPHLQDIPKFTHNMAQGYAIWIGLVVIAVLCVASWFLSPKGENQVLWRSSLLLAIISCYLMWAITFLAQLPPLIAPRRGDLREEFLE